MTRTRRHGFLHQYSFAILLIALFGMLIGSPFAAELSREIFGLTPQASIAPMVFIMIICAVLALWTRVESRLSSIVFGAAAILLVLLSAVFSQNTLTLVHLVGQLVFLLYVTTVIAREVFRAPVVDNNILYGAACLYMLVGVFIGFVYCLIEFVQPGSFRVTDLSSSSHHDDPLVNPGWLVYFSFTTLTTVGLGDVLPTSPIARSFASMEAVIGQIIVVVMIARLVGMNVAQATSGSVRKMVSQEPKE